MSNIKLQLPLKDIFVTQGFGFNYFDFYAKMGLRGHNGVDFRAIDGCKCYSSHSGIITWAGVDGDGGISVQVWDKDNGYKTVYYHLRSVSVKENDEVKAGDLIGYCNNSGTMTTGSHLHIGFKEVDFYGKILNIDNGYRGAINPAPYFNFAYDGTPIGAKDWYKSRCYHRYYRGRPKGGYWIERYRVVPALIKYLRRLPNNEEINAATYGGWDRESIVNPSMYEIWSQLKKDEFVDKKLIPFQ